MKTDNPVFSAQFLESDRRSRFDPLKNFTAAKLSTALANFRAGNIRDLARIIDAQEETDDVLSCVVPKSKAAVCRHGWDVVIGETQDEAEEALALEQKKALRTFYNNLRVTNAIDQDELGGVSLLLRQMMDAKGKRYSVHNIQWRPMVSGGYTATFWHTPLWFFENTTGRMRFLQDPFNTVGVEMEPQNWLVTRGQGVGIACAIAWLFKHHFALHDWAIYSKRHGMPGIEGITDAAPGSKDWSDMVKAVEDAASEFKWVRNRTNEIKTIDFSAQGELPFPALVDRMDRALSALWRGADLSTISSSSGQGTGASLQGDEADMLEQADAMWLSETLQLKIDRVVLDNVFGPDVPTLAYFKVLGSDRQNVEQDLKIDEFLAEHGHPISQQQAAERYSRPLPDDKDMDTLLVAPVAPAALPMPGPGPSDAPTLPAPDGDPNDPPEDAINERLAAATAPFDLAARRDLSEAQRTALAPMVTRLVALTEIEDDAELKLAAEQFQRDLPRLQRDVLADPAVARVFAEIIGASLVSGFFEAAEGRQPVKSPEL